MTENNKFWYIKIPRKLKEEFDKVNIDWFTMWHEQTMKFLLKLYNDYNDKKSEK